MLSSTLITVDPAYLGIRPTINYMAFITVFKPSAWLVMLFFVIVSVLSYMIYFKIAEGSKLSKLISPSLSFAYFMVLKFGNIAIGSKISGKLFFLFLAAFSTVAMSFYEGMLTCFMTAGEPQNEIRSFADLIDSKYHLVVSRGSTHHQDLKAAQLGSGKQRAFDFMKKRYGDSIYMDNQMMATLKSRMIEDPNLIAYANVLTFLGDSRFLPLNIEDKVAHSAALAFPKDSELLELFNHNMIWYHQSGVQVSNVFVHSPTTKLVSVPCEELPVDQMV